MYLNDIAKIDSVSSFEIIFLVFFKYENKDFLMRIEYLFIQPLLHRQDMTQD